MRLEFFLQNIFIGIHYLDNGISRKKGGDFSVDEMKNKINAAFISKFAPYTCVMQYAFDFND